MEAYSKMNIDLEIFCKQLIEVYQINCLAEKRNSSELLEISSYYIFDLLDWGRKNLALQDTNELKIPNIPSQSNLEQTTVLDLENKIEAKLLRKH